MNIKRKISFFLQKMYGSDTDERQIRMRVRWDGNIVQFNVGYNIDPDKWDPRTGRCTRNSSNRRGATAFEINSEIQRLEGLVDDVFKSYEVMGEQPTKDALKFDFNKAIGKEVGIANDLIVQRCFNDYIIEKSRIWSDSTILKHRSIKRLLCDFCPEWRMKDVTQKSLQEYTDFLVGRNMKNSTIKKNISFLRAFFLWSAKKGFLKSEGWKEYDLELKTITNDTVVFLTWEELMKLYNFTFPEGKGYLERTKDVFCFQCFSSLRYSDVAKLKRSDVYDDYIHVCTKKTDRSLNIDLNDRSRAILEKYKDEVFEGDLALPVVSNQKMNEFLKEVCYVVGIDSPVTKTYYKGRDRIEETHKKYELISSHCGRRTFICNALLMGITPETVMKWTGHSDYKAMSPYVDVADKHKKEAMGKFNK